MHKQGNYGFRKSLSPDTSNNVFHLGTTTPSKAQNRKGFFASNRDGESTSTAKHSRQESNVGASDGISSSGLLRATPKPNETITGERYEQQLMQLSRALKLKRP